MTEFKGLHSPFHSVWKIGGWGYSDAKLTKSLIISPIFVRIDVFLHLGEIFLPLLFVTTLISCNFTRSNYSLLRRQPGVAGPAAWPMPFTSRLT